MTANKIHFSDPLSTHPRVIESIPDFDVVMIGHFAKDRLVVDGHGETASGGAVYYGGVALRRLGMRVAVVTRLHPDDFPLLDELKQEGVQVFATPASETSGIENIYDSSDMERRICKSIGFAGPFRPEDIPDLSARIYVVASIIAGEVDLPLLKSLARRGPVAIDIQGFVRVREDGGPSASSGQAPSTSSGQAPSTSSGQAPSASSGQAPSASSGQAPSASSGQAPSTGSPVPAPQVQAGQALVFRQWPEMEEGLSHVTYLKVDRAEAELLTGLTDTPRSPAGMVAAVHRLAEYGPREIVLTQSSGVTVFADGEIYQAPFTPRSLAGRTGRGDTCFATYLGRRLTASPEEATRLAAAVTTLKQEQPGPWRGTLADAEALLAGEGCH